MFTKDNSLLNEFNEKKEMYFALEEAVTTVLNRVIKDNNLFVMDIQHRVKNEASLKGKLIKKGGKYKSLYDITDLVGFRIICYFTDTVDLIAKALESHLVIDWNNSVDKRAALDTTQFGYLSLHYICNLKESEEHKGEICRIPFEIQIRTVLQHAWAEIEHDLGYKSSFGVPKMIRRDFSRIAGLLEIADNEFITLRNNTKKYTEDIKKRIANDEGDDITIDKISLNEYVSKSKQISDFILRLKKDLNIDVEIIELGFSFVKQIEWLGIETIGDMYTLFDTYSDFAYKQIKKLVDSFGIDIITSTAILKLLGEGRLINENYNEVQIRKYLMIEDSDERQIERNIKRLLSMKEEV